VWTTDNPSARLFNDFFGGDSYSEITQLLDDPVVAGGAGALESGKPILQRTRSRFEEQDDHMQGSRRPLA
jgi:hypothetical protein